MTRQRSYRPGINADTSNKEDHLHIPIRFCGMPRTVGIKRRRGFGSRTARPLLPGQGTVNRTQRRFLNLTARVVQPCRKRVCK